MAAPPVEIPGYYWDEERNKYFKIESSSTAPASAAWSEQNVRKRQAAAEDAESGRRRELLMAVTMVKRDPALTHPVVGGFLRSDLGESGLSGALSDQREQHSTRLWAMGLQDKGRIRVGSSDEDWADKFVVIGGESRAGLGLLFGTNDRETVYSQYFARDRTNRIKLHVDTDPALSRYLSRNEEPLFTQQGITSINFHAGTESIILTSNRIDPPITMTMRNGNNMPGAEERRMRMPPNYRVRICRLARYDVDEADEARQQGEEEVANLPGGRPGGRPSRRKQPTWELGGARVITLLGSTPRSCPPILSCAVAPSPSNSLHAVFGTERGVYALRGVRGGGSGGGGVNDESIVCVSGGSAHGNHNNPLSTGEVFAVDFFNGHPDVLVAGGRGGAGVCVADLREPSWDWRSDGDGDGAGDNMSVPELGVDHGTGILPPQRLLRCHPTCFYHDLLQELSNKKKKKQKKEQQGQGEKANWTPSNGYYTRVVLPEFTGGSRHRWLQIGDPGSISSGPSKRYSSRVVNRVVSLNQFQVLSASVGEDALNVWDARVGCSRRAYTAFEGYRNPARVGSLGLAVEKGSGTVAAANDDGTVGLWDLRSGTRLVCPAVDRVGRPPEAMDRSWQPRVSCLQWETLPGDVHPTLFAAVGPDIRSFSFGMRTTDGLDEF